jgi:hypothetical protein
MPYNTEKVVNGIGRNLFKFCYQIVGPSINYVQFVTLKQG